MRRRCLDKPGSGAFYVSGQLGTYRVARGISRRHAQFLLDGLVGYLGIMYLRLELP